MKRLVYLLILLCIVKYGLTIVVPQNPECNGALGLESGYIKDSQFHADDRAIVAGKLPQYARLNNDLAWCMPNSPQSSSSVFRDEMYLEVKLFTRKKITAVALQGFQQQYSYGEYIKVSYFEDDQGYIAYKYKDLETMIKVKNEKGDNFEYLIFDPPIFSAQIKIYLLYDANIKCLRMELYGCEEVKSNLLEYADCANPSAEILTNDPFNDPSVIVASKSLAVATTMRGSHILFDQPYAWCIRAEHQNNNLFREFVTINFPQTYLIYALKVDGYRDNLNDIETDKYLTQKFKFSFSFDDKNWADFYGGMEFKSKDYLKNKLQFQKAISAKYLRLFMEEQLNNITCIKLQLYGCPAILKDEVTTTVSLLTTLPPTNTNLTTISTTPQFQARITYYKIKQGSEYQGVSFKDRTYDREANFNKELDKGNGCLTDNVQSVNNPFTDTDSCVVGWHARIEPDPYIMVKLSREAVFQGIRITSYIDASRNAGPIRGFKVSSSAYADLFDNLRYACTPDSVYQTTAQTYNFVLDYSKISFNYLKVEFEYSSDWILVRQINLIPDNLPSDAIAMSSTRTTCVVPTPIPGPLPDPASSSNIVIVICIVMTILLVLLITCIVYRYRKNLRRTFLKGPAQKALVVQTQYHRPEDEILMHAGRDGSAKSNQSLMRRDYNSQEDMYAAPDQFDYTQVNVQEDYEYEAPDRDPYAQPNEPVTNPIYQTSAIYATTYENPYKAVIASSLYADPSKCTKEKSSYKIFPRHQLDFKERIGVGQFGEVHIARATGLDEIYGTVGHYNSWELSDTAIVAVKMLKSKDEDVHIEFMKEVDIMSRLKHENVVRLLGICDDGGDKLMVVEYMENGDLHQYLRDRRPCHDTHNVRLSQIDPDVLLPDQLLHMAEQIAAGVKYLHSEGFVHRDLATRNCLVGPALQVKISDFGMSRYLYSKHYYRVEGKAVLPIRWMAPESLYFGTFSPETDVWSFAVTMWEVLTFARESPYEHLDDQQLIARACEAVQDENRPFELLPRPSHCPPEIYDIICKCWDRQPKNRPTFTYLHRFFKEQANSAEMEL